MGPGSPKVPVVGLKEADGMVENNSYLSFSKLVFMALYCLAVIFLFLNVRLPGLTLATFASMNSLANRNKVSRRCDGVRGGTFLTPGMASVPEMAASAMTDAEVLKMFY